MTQDILIVIDLQNDVCEQLYQRENLLTKVNQRIAVYRAAGKPILFIQHNEIGLESGSKGWQLVPELDARTTDFYMDKTHANGFYHTNLQELLTGLSVKNIEFCGAQTEYCVNTTLVFAHGLGYKNFMVHGATATVDNTWLTAEKMIQFYEDKIWKHRFLEFLD